MFDSKRRFVQENYTTKTPFSSFLPGIAGKTGIPLWCFYVNRGQAIAGFGVSGKANAILPFQPAGRAYRTTETSAFRSFIIIDGKDFYEPFQDEKHAHRMTIGMNSLHLLERNEEAGLRVSVRYCVLPEEPVAALLRQVEIRNCGRRAIELEAADGLPQLLPYGLQPAETGYAEQKAQSRTLARHIAPGLPYLQMQSSSRDGTRTECGHFAFAFNGAGEALPDIVDVNIIFGYDTGLRYPRALLRDGVEGALARRQGGINAYPSCFFLQKARLDPGETLCFNALFGYAASEKHVLRCREKLANSGAFDQKYSRAVQLTEELCRPITTKTGDPVFNAYCDQCFLDNLLRGGVPERIGGADNPRYIHIYRRMNGDLERDYNDFVIEPEYYSQGEVYFDDVLQNRQCDVRFYPEIAENSLKALVDLIQPDGYQPLIVEVTSLYLEKNRQEAVLSRIDPEDRPAAEAFLEKRFTPGRFVMEAENWRLCEGTTPCGLLDIAASHAERKSGARYGEGYWTGYWCELLDLFLRFEEIYPDRAEEELFARPVYLYFLQKAAVKPRSKRYVLTGDGVRQYGIPDPMPPLRNRHKWARSRYGDGERVRVTLAEKLLLLATLKFATLDAWGFGIEMEAGRAGWSNGLNGLPEVFGSASGDVCELLRLISFLLARLEKTGRNIELSSEIAGLFIIISSLAKKYRELFTADDDIMDFWRETNEARESYRNQVAHGFSGNRVTVEGAQICAALRLWRSLLLARKRLVIHLHGGLHPAYLYYEVSEYKQTGAVIEPERFTLRTVPVFLEGAIHQFDFCTDTEERRILHKMVMNGQLYDRKLQMLRSCGSFGDAMPRALGDIGAFNPGWYANQSISLQLEYKYLRKLLRYGLYDEFADCLRRFAVPFLDEEVYGRSPLENASFLVSSLSADENVIGRGMEARYTGSNAEFMYIWQCMMIGPRPFTMAEGELRFGLCPMIPDYLLPKAAGGSWTASEQTYVDAKLFGRIELRYLIGEGCSVVPGSYRIARYKVYYAERCEVTEGEYIFGEAAQEIRACKPDRINVYLEKREASKKEPIRKKPTRRLSDGNRQESIHEEELFDRFKL